MEFKRTIDCNAPPSVAKDTPHSPTDSLLSPCSKKMLKMRPGSFRKERDFTHVMKNDAVVANPTDIPLVLGSSSMSRRGVLERHGWNFTTMSPDIDEKAIRDDNPLELPLKIAKAKAYALIQKLNPLSTNSSMILITADQIVLYKGTIREKPSNNNEAFEFLNSYSNDKVSTFSAIVVTHIPSGRQSSNIDIASICWNTISSDVIERVIARGHVYNSAGGFCIEDEDLKPLIVGVEGTMDSILGMPMSVVARCISDVITSESVTDTI